MMKTINHVSNIFPNYLATVSNFLFLMTMGYFSTLFGHWEQFLMNLGYLSNYLATGEKLVTIGDLGCISKRFISIHTWKNKW